MFLRLLFVVAVFVGAVVVGAKAETAFYFRQVAPGTGSGSFVPPMTDTGPVVSPPVEPQPEPETPPVPSTATILAPGGWSFLVMNWPAAPAPRYASVSRNGHNLLFQLYWTTQACGLVGYGWTDGLNLHVEPGRCDTWGAIAALEIERSLPRPDVILMHPGAMPAQPIVFFDTAGNPQPLPPVWPPV